MAAKKQNELELIVYNFVRNNYEEKSNINVPIALKYVMMQFSAKIFQSKILSFQEA